MVYRRIFLLTRNYLHAKIWSINTRAIAQLGRAPRLHARQCFSEKSIMQSKELLFLKNRCLTLGFEETKQENNSLTINSSSVQFKWLFSYQIEPIIDLPY